MSSLSIRHVAGDNVRETTEIQAAIGGGNTVVRAWHNGVTHASVHVAGGSITLSGTPGDLYALLDRLNDAIRDGYAEATRGCEHAQCYDADGHSDGCTQTEEHAA